VGPVREYGPRLRCDMGWGTRTVRQPFGVRARSAALDARGEPILGTVALENTGIIVEPISKTLERLHAKPLK